MRRWKQLLGTKSSPKNQSSSPLIWWKLVLKPIPITYKLRTVKYLKHRSDGFYTRRKVLSKKNQQKATFYTRAIPQETVWPVRRPVSDFFEFFRRKYAETWQKSTRVLRTAHPTRLSISFWLVFSDWSSYENNHSKVGKVVGRGGAPRPPHTHTHTHSQPRSTSNS